MFKFFKYMSNPRKKRSRKNYEVVDFRNPHWNHKFEILNDSRAYGYYNEPINRKHHHLKNNTLVAIMLGEEEKLFRVKDVTFNKFETNMFFCNYEEPLYSKDEKEYIKKFYPNIKIV